MSRLTIRALPADRAELATSLPGAVASIDLVNLQGRLQPGMIRESGELAIDRRSLARAVVGGKGGRPG
jgi:hypothetical protein